MGLVDYGSDSDEEVPSVPPTSVAPVPPQPAKAPESTAPSPQPVASAPNEPERPPPPEEDDAPIVGPQRPPSVSLEPEEDEGDRGPPMSPYTTSRNLIHNLTLPPSIPEIPPSPPGSPPPPLSAKFSHFRDLKTKGVHFNEKLLRSSSLRNPNLLQKLTAFMGFEDTDQYASNLSPDLWDPARFGKEAFVEELAKSQAAIGEARAKAKLEAGRDRIEFVGSVQTPPPPAQKERVTESAADRVLKGLDREGRAPPARDGRRDRDEGRGGRRDDRDRRRDDDRDRRRDDGRDRKRDDDRDRRRDDDYRDRRREDDYRDRRRRSRTRSRDRDRERVDKRHRDVEYRARR